MTLLKTQGVTAIVIATPYVTVTRRGCSMRVEGKDVILSASDLMRFMSCKHASALDLRYARGEPLEPADDTEDAKILQKQGDDHESRYLAKLKAEGHSVIEFRRDVGLAAAAQATCAALSQGPDVLFQGAFF